MTLRSLATAVVFVMLALLAVGCGAPLQLPSTAPLQGEAITGKVYGGQQPIAGAHVYLFAANTTGYGSASVSLLNSANTGQSDSLGAYVLSGSDGSFAIGGDYTCTPNTQVYLYANGGNPGAGTNSHAGFMAVLGNCPSADNFATATPSVQMNEVTTVAAAYAIAGYAYGGGGSSATHVSSSGTTLAQTGIANAFANAANLVDISTGTARTTTLGGNGTVPTATIYTLANILAACVNTADQTGMFGGGPSAACDTLVRTPASRGDGTGYFAADTATEAIFIAQHPGYGVSTLYNLPNGNYAFGGGLTTPPSDFSLTLVFTGGGISDAENIAVDASGNIWVSDNARRMEKLSPLGAILSGTSGYTDASLNAPGGMAIDSAGDCWVINTSGSYSTLTEFSSTGTEIANPALPAFGRDIAFDTAGNLWAPNFRSTTQSYLSEITAGTLANTYTVGNQATPVAVDISNRVWIGNYVGANVSEVVSGSVASPSPYSMNFSGGEFPYHLALDSSGDIWALGTDSSLSAITSGGALFANAPYSTAAGTHIQGEALALDGANVIYTLDRYVYQGGAFIPYVAQPKKAFASEELYPRQSGDTYQLSQFTYAAGTLTTLASFVPPGISVFDMALDGSGNLWVAAGSQVDEMIGLATPVVTPVAANLVSPYSAPASKP